MGFVYDHGGSIARLISGKWKGTLASPKVDRRPEGVQGLLPGDLEGQQDYRPDLPPNPYYVYAQGLGRVDDRPWLVQLLCRRQVQGARRRSS